MEPLLPERVRNDGHLHVALGHFFLGGESASQERLYAEHLEVVAHYGLAIDLVAIFALAERELSYVVGGQLRDGLDVPQVAEVRIRRPVAAAHPEVERVVRIGGGDAPDEDGLKHAEDGQVQSDSQRQRHDGDSQQSGTLKKRPETVTQILQHARPLLDCSYGRNVQ